MNAVCPYSSNIARAVVGILGRLKITEEAVVGGCCVDSSLFLQAAQEQQTWTHISSNAIWRCSKL